jgi:hypothetical protein
MRGAMRSWIAVACTLTLVVGSSQQTSASQAQVGLLHRDATQRAQGGIAVVGDSLTVAYFAGLDDALRAQQWGPIAIEARSGRRTLVSNYTHQWSASSGIDAIRRLRSTGFDSSIWIVALGTNDISHLAGDPVASDALIDTVMAEIGAGRRVVWVNVFSLSISAKAHAIELNARLANATTRHPLLSIADWFSLASANLSWFVDNLHTNLAGAIARNAFVSQAALMPRCQPPIPGPLPLAPPAQVEPSSTGVATSSAVATGRCRV